MPFSRRPTLPLLLLALAGLSLLAAGAVHARHAFLVRGTLAAPSPIPHGGPQPGLNVYLDQIDDDALDANLGQIQALGVDVVKQSFHFPGPSATFDWATADRLLTAAADHNLTLIPLLDGNPADDFAPPADPTDFANWAGAFAARYGRQLRHYMIWDEPNLTSHWGGRSVNPAEYAALLTAAADAIRAADPDAVIVAAPLAPTAQTGPQNLADPLYLQALYEAGAADSFDVVAAKPYGFDASPDDRTVALNTLNFSRAILLREVLEANGEGHKAVWAGNWGWNALPPDWNGRPSIWGQVDPATQATWTAGAFERARREWPWMGLMFLENWQPAVPPDDPRWGFSVAGRPTADVFAALPDDPTVAMPGFHPARPGDPAQTFDGGWRFSPEFGADISQTGDRVSLRFWGTDVAVRVRRADFRARFYATVDGRPANALPHDENGAALVLTSPDEGTEALSIEPVARNLPPGEHTLTLVAERGWDQWALNGFSVAYQPPDPLYRYGFPGLLAAAVALLLLAMRIGRRTDWRGVEEWLRGQVGQWSWALTAVVGAVVALSGWLTWGAQAAGLYRRLPDGGQLALTGAAAAVFYVAPSFFIYVAALVLLFGLIYFRPAWGLALIAFSIPFAVRPRPIFGYRFSPVEVFILTTLAAFLLSRLTFHVSRLKEDQPLRLRFPTFHPADTAVLLFVAVATLSLFVTERLDVASNEWRVVVVEPALFYGLLRAIRPGRREMGAILDAFVLGGLVVALIGLWQVAFAPEQLITAEGGLMRLRSIYGSPNNVALYLGRILPLLAAVALLGQTMNGRRRWGYALAAVPMGAAVLLTFSKGALFLGLPAALLLVGLAWLTASGRRVWPWLAGLGVVVALGIFTVWQVPALAARLNPGGATGFFRLNLWQASLNMIAEHPLLGVGLDNFLYAYRGRYIFDAAWQEPNLSHPHNLLLDFGVRLGVLGMAAGGWLIWSAARALLRALRQAPASWRPVALGLLAGLIDMLAHGLVDHGFFLTDLALAFYLMLATAVWLADARRPGRNHLD